MLISTRTLERQLDCVGRLYRFVSLDELGEHLESGARTARPLAAVTFDDGYRDSYQHAFPLLRKKGIPAAVFVVTDLLGTSQLQTHDRLHLALARLLEQSGGARRLAGLVARLHLEPPGLEKTLVGKPVNAFRVMRVLFESLSASDLERVLESLAAEGVGETRADALLPLTWEMVAEMSRGGFTVGSHTHRHVPLNHESRDRVREELRTSRRMLETRLGMPIRHFAYPDGRFDASVVDEVAAAGYRYAYTTCRHRDSRLPLLTVPRRCLWENSSRDRSGRFSAAVLQCQVRGVFDFVNPCRQRHA
jgi:peptidoglycan/xylan/chitin deacetylase (PgdA/CDA1 family)